MRDLRSYLENVPSLVVVNIASFKIQCKCEGGIVKEAHRGRFYWVCGSCNLFITPILNSFGRKK